jgi:site-specific DNA-methyltransferase (adenine-specific)
MSDFQINAGVTAFDNIKLHRADCMEVMAGYPDKYFDLAVVDPPYGIGAGKHNMGAEKNTETFYKKKNWDEKPPTAAYFEELDRVSNNQVIWGGNYFDLWPSKNYLIWDKKIGHNDFAMCELAWTSCGGSAKMFSMCGTHLTQGKRIHPTQKPVKLYSWIYANYAKAGMKILDTHLGSGSNAIAAHYAKMGEFVGCELDADYFKAACERVYRETRQQELF